MSTNSVYQQVRSHLAYLKLTAAAEALPAQLDEAKKAKATHTEFLHRLLGIEVDVSGWRAASSPTYCGHGLRRSA